MGCTFEAMPPCQCEKPCRGGWGWTNRECQNCFKFIPSCFILLLLDELFQRIQDSERLGMNLLLKTLAGFLHSLLVDVILVFSSWSSFCCCRCLLGGCGRGHARVNGRDYACGCSRGPWLWSSGSGRSMCSSSWQGRRSRSKSRARLVSQTLLL